MAAVICSLGLDRIVELCEAKGLTRWEVMEATLMNCLKPFQNPRVVDIMNVRLSIVEEDERLTADVKAVENYLLNLPGELTGVVTEFLALGTFNGPRSAVNWEIVESVMCANDAVVASEVAKRDGVGHGTKH